MKQIVLVLVLAGLTASVNGAEIATCTPDCSISVGGVSISATADQDMVFVAGSIQQLTGTCDNCDEDALLDVFFSRTETFTLDPVGGTGMAQLIASYDDWQDANDDVGGTGLDYVVPNKLDRSLPFQVTLTISGGGTVHVGNQYVGGSHVRAWRLEDISAEASTPEPSTYAMLSSGLLAVCVGMRFKEKNSKLAAHREAR